MSFSQIFEIVFDIFYLIVIWLLVGKMLFRENTVNLSDKPVAQKLLTGFMFLAIGDTAHVGFRVIAYLMGGLDSFITVGGLQIPLVGLGAFCTAYTITLLYMIIVDTWRLRFNKKRGALYILIQAVAIFRLAIMLFPQNEWSSTVPPFDWSLYRNMPLTFVGLAIAVLILIDASNRKDTLFRNFALLIFASYLFYLPVILFYRIAPWVGMLMIPKTVAYILMALLVYKSFFTKKGAVKEETETIDL